MRTILAALMGAGVGLGVGAKLMYLFDPEQGADRRSYLWGAVNHAIRRFIDFSRKTSRHLRQGASGLVGGGRSRGEEQAAPGDVLAARVRSKVGRVVSHPSSIEVAVDGGHVTLSGPVLAREADRLLRAVASMKGVDEVEDRLSIFAQADAVPGLQGGSVRARQ